MGYGPASFKHAITPELGYLAQTAHNSYVSVLIEEGLVGLLLFLAMIGCVFRDVLRLPRLERRFALVLLAALCVAMLPLTWEDEKVVWLIMAAVVVLSHARVDRVVRPLRQPSYRRPGLTSPALARHPGGPRPATHGAPRQDGET
jgi:O-antigen ligase